MAKFPINCFLLLTFMFGSCSLDYDANKIALTENLIPQSGEEAAINAFNEFLTNFNSQTRSGVTPTVAGVRKTNTSTYSNKLTTRSKSKDGMPIYELVLENQDSSEGFAIALEDFTKYDVLA